MEHRYRLSPIRRVTARAAFATALLATSGLVAAEGAMAAGEIEDIPGAYVDITGDGRYIIGNAGSPYTTAFIHYRLPDSQGGQGLGSLAGTNSWATAISGTGAFVTGFSSTENGWFNAFRWTFDGGLENLGTLYPHESEARSEGHGISDDGTRVVGHSSMPGEAHGFVWIEGSTLGVIGNARMYQLNELDGHTYSAAAAISGDGRYATGYSALSAGVQRAVRWDLSGLGEEGGDDTVTNIGALTGMDGWSIGNDISADGRFIVGASTNGASASRAFLWQEGYTEGVASNRQMRDLGTLGGGVSNALAVSRNGHYVVGTANDETETSLAFRWSDIDGMEAVAEWLQRHGVDVGNRLLKQASGITDDGNIIVGHMEIHDNGSVDYRGYIARVVPETDPGEDPGGDPGPGPGLMDVEEYHNSLAANASAASTTEFLAWLPLNGAHHRPLMLQPTLAGDTCVWATGDFARHNGDEASLALAEMGGCLPIADEALVGFGVGTSHAWQDLARGGDSQFGGYYGIAEIDWQPSDTSLVFSLTGLAGRWDIDVRRGYSNGADTDYSVGETDAQGVALRARVDWLDAATLGNTSLNPFASVGISSVHVDGYGETGGAFPARFDGQTMTSREVRLGVTAVTEITQAATLSTTLEAVYRGGDVPGTSGTVPGVLGFDLGGGTGSDIWVRAGAELDFAITDSAAISASFNAATAGGDATMSGSLGLRAQF